MKVMACTRRVLLPLFLVAAAAVLTPALATHYTVGDTQGWTTGVDYDTWASSKSFKVGDTLLFQYSGLHSVDEVSKSNYDSCSSSNAIATNSDGSTKISLDAAGSRYFICGTPTHCSGGMKLAVATTSASSGAANSPATPTPSGGSSNSTPPSDSTTPSDTNTPPAAPSGKNTASGRGFRVGEAAVLGGLIGLGIALVG
ncbi:hypothetical protein KSP40_PGU003033 [Platanthera guangdongensis]|uniref:Phytocyanin domain-containing protein n=1 Tax=Platanthera guangdongensis TaxID=2320717 RepID=A0ABR2MKY3_9ASPA